MNNEDLAIQIWKLLKTKPDFIDRLEILSNLIGDCLEPFSEQDQLLLLEKIVLEIKRKINVQ